MGGKQDMRDLCEHWIGEILDHQAHSVSFCPATTEKSPCLGLAGLQRYSCPPQLSSQPHKFPVMGAFIQEERPAGRDLMHVDGVFLQLIGKRLLNIQEHLVKSQVIPLQPVENIAHVCRISNGAVKVRAQAGNSQCSGDVSNLYGSLVIPFGIVPPELDLEAFQPIPSDPVGKLDRVSIFRLIAREFVQSDGVQPSNQMPSRKGLLRSFQECVWIPPFEAHRLSRRCL